MVGPEILALCAFGATFLFADAHIFGVGTQKYIDEVQFWSLRDQLRLGVLPLRPLLLRFHIFRELLRCYFCTGVWAGMGMHTVLLNLYGSHYVLGHPQTWQGWTQGLVVAALYSAPAVYVLDLLVKLLEQRLEEEGTRP